MKCRGPFANEYQAKGVTERYKGKITALRGSNTIRFSGYKAKEGFSYLGAAPSP